MKKQRRADWSGYAIAVVGTALAVAPRYMIVQGYESRLVGFGILYLAVALSAWFGGTRPAILATVLGCAVAEYFLVDPFGLFGSSRFIGLSILGIYLISCGLIIRINEARQQETLRARELETAIVAKQRRLGAEIADKELAEAEARAQAERFRVMADSAPVLIWMSGPDREQNWYNKPWLEFVGRSLEEEQAVDWGENIHPADYDRCIRVYQESFEDQTPFTLEYRLKRRDGAYRWVIDNGVPLYGLEGEFTGFIGSCTDITDRKAAEDAVEAKETQLRLITDAVPAMISYVDARGRYVLNNNAYGEWFKVDVSTLTGKTIEEVIGPQLWALAKPHSEAALSGRDAHFEVQATNHAGEERWLEVHYIPDFGSQGEVRGFVTLINDLTDHKRIQDTIQYQSDLLSTITENAHSMLVMLDHEGRVTFANSAAISVVGFTPKELVGKVFHDTVHYANPEGLPYPIEECLIGRPNPPPQSILNQEETFFRKDGSQFPALCSASRIIRSGQVVATVLEIQDITEQKRSIASLEASEARFQSFMDHSPALSWIKDDDGRYIFVNKALEELNGWKRSNWQNKTDWDIYPKELAEVYRANDEVVLADGKVRQFNETVYENGVTRQLLAIKFPMRVGEGRWQIGGMAIDVTESIRAEEALRASEARFQAFMEFSPTLAWIKNQSGQYVFVNRAMRKSFGWSPKDSQLKTDSDLFPSEVALRLSSHDRDVIEKGDVIEFVEVLPSVGENRHFLMTVFPMRVGEGQWHIGGKAIDITERVQAEEALARSERELNDFFENAPIGLHWVGPDGIIQRANRAELELLGLTKSEYVGHSITEFHVEPNEIESMMSRLQTGESLDNYPARLRCKDGTIKDVLISSNSLMERGEFIRSRCFTRDVTQEKAALGALQDSEERFRVLAESIPSIVWTAAPDGTITYANKHWLEYCGITAEANATGWPELVLHPDDYDRTVEKWTRALQEGTEYEIEVRNRRHDGAYRWFVTRAVPIRDESGNVKSWFGVTTDIHDQKLMQEQLKEADKRKDEFLATLAHELRNPLAPIRNAVQLLRMPNQAEDDRQRSTDIIDRQAAQLVRLVDDLLEASRLSRGRLELRRSRTTLSSAIEQALTSSAPLIESMGHSLEVSTPSEPVEMFADSFRLAQVFSNLLNNSAKYTRPGGKIWLTAEKRGDTVRISVKDNGIGIDGQHLRNIFDMFWQAIPALDRTESGLGIGLSLVKSLVQLHGGTVEAHSEGIGKGSEFIVTLPLALAGQTDEVKAVVQVDPSRAGGNLHVLVVDDNQDSAHTLSLLLQLMGHETETAYDGVEALQKAEKFRPDILLLDIGLPEMNGYDVARAIRTKDWGKNVALVALSGWGQESDKRQAIEAGFDVHLTKPVDFTSLENMLASLALQKKS